MAATLQVLAEDSSLFDDDLGSRVALYRTFVSMWSSVGLNLKTEVFDGGDTPVDRHLEQITPLYVRPSSYAPWRASRPTRPPKSSTPRPATFLRFWMTPGEIAAQVATDVLIIEDEPMIAMDLESIVEGLGHRVAGVARTHAEAVNAASNHKPGLVLADIQLADGSSGLDAVNEILGSFEVPVIFITAYPDRLLTGERPEPAFLITKPYQPDTVKAIVSQALFFEQHAKRKA